VVHVGAGRVRGSTNLGTRRRGCFPLTTISWQSLFRILGRAIRGTQSQITRRRYFNAPSSSSSLSREMETEFKQRLFERMRRRWSELTKLTLGYNFSE